VLHAEDHHPQGYADLRRREPGSVERLHRVLHVLQERVQLGRVERAHLA
jgi:hypothetical protein